MRILVVSAFEADSRRAHVVNTIKMAQGFVRLGHEVGIICFRPSSGNISADRLSEIYGLTEPIKWIQLPRKILDWSFDVHWEFSQMALLVARWHKPDMVYSRSYVFPYLSSKFGIPTVAESHAHVGEKSDSFLQLVKASSLPSFRAWITISNVLGEYYNSIGVPAEKIVTVPDAVDLNLFRCPTVLPESPYHSAGLRAVYSGHLYNYKGIPTILESARYLPHVNFELVGGLPEDIKRHKAEVEKRALRNVTFHGMIPQKQLPLYLWSASVLLLTHTLSHPSAAWTSPLKLGEYLASGVPIVASDIPALRALVSETEVEFVKPDDGKKLAAGILKILNDSMRARQLSYNASIKAETYSYEDRARLILDYLRM